MAYRSSSAALPQNSLTPAPANPDSDARILATKRAINEGRQRLYDNTPPISSFLTMGPGVAADAARMMQRSELAHQSMFGAGPLQSTSEDQTSHAPIVVPLNGTPAEIAGSQVQPVVRSAAPTVTMPERIPQGMSGYSPPWADALARGTITQKGDSGSSWWKWLLILGGVLLVANAANGKGRK